MFKNGHNSVVNKQWFQNEHLPQALRLADKLK